MAAGVKVCVRVHHQCSCRCVNRFPREAFVLERRNPDSSKFYEETTLEELHRLYFSGTELVSCMTYEGKHRPNSCMMLAGHVDLIRLMVKWGHGIRSEHKSFGDRDIAEPFTWNCNNTHPQNLLTAGSTFMLPKVCMGWNLSESFKNIKIRFGKDVGILTVLERVTERSKMFGYTDDDVGLPGGKTKLYFNEKGELMVEDYKSTAIRECWEETGIHISEELYDKCVRSVDLLGKKSMYVHLVCLPSIEKLLASKKGRTAEDARYYLTCKE